VRRYELPILAGREPDATDSAVQRGKERAEELAKRVEPFILRRTNALLSAHLPPKARCAAVQRNVPADAPAADALPSSRRLSKLCAASLQPCRCGTQPCLVCHARGLKLRLCCDPQQIIYEHFLHSKTAKQLLNQGKQSKVLPAINGAWWRVVGRTRLFVL
jgi:hypothetical protein